MSRRGKTVCVCLVGLLTCCAAAARAAVTFSEDFSSGSLPAHLELTAKHVAPGQAEVNPGGDLVDLSGGNVTYLPGEFNRQYVQTVDADYSRIDFVYEATVTTSGLSDWSMASMGMGAGGTDPAFSGQPLSTARLDANLWNSSDIFRTGDNGVFGGVGGVPLADATHRLRMTWDAASRGATYEVDLDYAGGAMAPDRIYWQDGSRNGFEATNSKLYFGGGNELVFDDVSVDHAAGSTIGTVNLALHKPVLFTSSQYQVANGRDFVGSHVTDGRNLGGLEQFEQDYWIAEDLAGSAYFVLDLQQQVDVAQITLFNTHNSNYHDRGTQQFEIFASNDLNPAGDDLLGGVSILAGELGNTIDAVPGQVFNAQTGLAAGQYRYLKFVAHTAYGIYACPGLNEIQVFGPGDPVSSLYWDGPDGAHWGDPNWTDPDGNPTGTFPDENVSAFVSTNTIHIAGVQAARRLAVSDGGGVIVDPQRSLSVVYQAEFAPGTSLTLGPGAGFSAEGGNLPAIAPTGDVTIGVTSGELTVAGYNDGLPAAQPRVLTKTGGGTFVLPTGGGLVAGQTTFRIEAGTLSMTGDRPVSGSSTIELAGGTLLVEEVITAGAGPAGAVAHWAFDETSGTTAQNAANPGTHDGTVVGAQWRPGEGALGGALYNAGQSGGHVNAGSGVDLAARSFSLAVWAKRDRPGDEDWLFGQDDDDAGTCNNSLAVGYRANNQFAVAFWCDDLNWPDPNPDTAWHHWAATYDLATNSQRLYKDGVEVAARTSAGPNNSSGDFWIGRIPGGRNFDGMIDEAYVYQSVLDPAQIAAMAGDRSFDMSDTPLLVTDDSTIEAVTGLHAPFGPLWLGGGVLTTSGAAGGISFQNTQIPDGATSVGLNTLVDTDPGVIIHNGADPPPAVIRTNGSVPLVLTRRNLNLTGDTFQVEGGLLRMVGTDPWGGSTSTVLDGGTLAIADVVGAPGTGTAPAGDLAAHWSFDDGTATDSSGRGNHGTLAGGVAATPGINGGGLHFDGVDGHVLVADSDSLDTGQTTSVAFWARWDAGAPPAGNYPRLVTKKHHWDDVSGWGVNIANNNDRALGANGSAGDNFYDQAAVDSWSAGGWHQVVVTCDGDAAAMYVDGRLSSNFGVTPIVDNGEPLYIARYAPGGHHWNGAMDEVYVYDRALSAAEAVGMYAGRTAPDTAAIDVTVTADSTLLSESTAEVALAGLTMKAGVLTTAGSSGFRFTGGTTVDATAVEVGFDPRSGIELGVIDVDSPQATIAKEGPGDLLMHGANVGRGFANATFSARGGRLIGVYRSSNPFGEAALEIDGGELLLVGVPQDTAVAYQNRVAAVSDGTITAGAAVSAGFGGSGTAVSLGSADRGVTLGGGATATLRSTHDCTLSISGPLSGAGGIRVTEGDVAISAGGSLGSLSALGGTLNTGGADLNVLTMDVGVGAVCGTGGNRVIVDDSLKLERTTFSADAAHSLAVSGDDLLAAAELTLSGGTVTVVGPPAPPANIPPDPSGYWSFDDGTATDGSGNGNHGTITGGVTAAAGMVGGALDFNGSDGHVMVPDAAPLDLGDTLSVAFWARWDSGAVPSGRWPRMITKKAVWNAASGWGVDVNNNDDTSVGVLDSATNLYASGVIDSWAAGGWHHVAVTYDTGTATVYTEGQPVQTFIVTPIVDNDEPLYFARYGPDLNHCWEGALDEIYIYDRALTDQEVSSLYTLSGGVVDVPNVNLVVAQSSTLAPDTLAEATFGDLTLAAGATLTLTGAPAASFHDLSAGDDATIAASIVVRGSLSPGHSPGRLNIVGNLEFGEEATYRCEIGQWDSTTLPDPWNPVPPMASWKKQGPVNDRLMITGGDALLGGRLELTAVSKLHPPVQAQGQPPGVMVEWFGDQTRIIASAGGENSVMYVFDTVTDAQPEVYDLPGTGNWGQGHIGRGAFLTRHSDDDPLVHPGVSYGTAGPTRVHLFQAADGDTNGDRRLDSLDIQAILSANAFPDVQPADWPAGDFTGDGWCNGLDIQAILATGLYPFLPGPYAASEPGDPSDRVVDLLLYAADYSGPDYPPGEAGTVRLSTDGVIISGYVIRSLEGIFSGGPAENLGWFTEDTDRQISGNMGLTLDGEHLLGDVIGDTFTGLPEQRYLGDLTFTYTIQGTPGTFIGRLIVVPEPGTLAMLLGGAAGMLLIWRRLRRV